MRHVSDGQGFSMKAAESARDRWEGQRATRDRDAPRGTAMRGEGPAPSARLTAPRFCGTLRTHDKFPARGLKGNSG